MPTTETCSKFVSIKVIEKDDLPMKQIPLEVPELSPSPSQPEETLLITNDGQQKTKNKKNFK
jgi:hypothetical protein